MCFSFNDLSVNSSGYSSPEGFDKNTAMILNTRHYGRIVDMLPLLMSFFLLLWFIVSYAE